MFTRLSHPSLDFTLLVKPTGALCNLACEYCFYLRKDQLYPESSLHMPVNVLKAYIKQYLHSQAGEEVCIAWQGGEPTLMGLDFFQGSIELVQKYKKPGQRVAFTLQTNGTLLDDEWCRFFKKHNFLIGLSLDGPAPVHNTYRVNKAGKGSFDQVRQGWELLQQHQVETNILCAVHAANASQPLEIYRFFRDSLMAKFIQFIPIVERAEMHRHSPGQSGLPIEEAGNLTACSIDGSQYGTFLIEIFDEWVHHDVGQVFIQNFETALASWCGLPASICTSQEICGRSLILEHNGDLYSCDHFVDADHRLGNILETPLKELVGSDRQSQFGLNKRQHLPAYCRRCDMLFACQGECPRNRFMHSPEGDAGLNYLCPGYKMFFHAVDKPMRTLAELIRHGRAPAEIMRMR